MPEIGTTLREARLRARMDLAQIEAQTKIRAKFLLALENEEWNVLPGQAYVKGFLRTYSEALGVDSKPLIDEYKRRFERPTIIEQQPIVPVAPRMPRQPVRLPREWAIGIVVVGLLAALFLLGKLPQENQSSTVGDRSPVVPPTTTPKPAPTPAAQPSPRASRFVRMQVLPTGLVWVCLEAAGKRRLINGVILQPGPKQPIFRSSEFKMTLGNNSVQLKVNGKVLTVPPVAEPIGYVITRRGRHVLDPQERPTCT